MIGSIQMLSKYVLVSEDDTIQLASELSRQLSFPISLYFKGDMGAGKTFFIRALLFALGVTGRIKSPTYSLVETYEVESLSICHLDLYRVIDEEELVYIGFQELYESTQLRLIEWPEKAPSLPEADMVINMHIFDQGHCAVIQSNTMRGEKVLASLAQHRVKQNT